MVHDPERARAVAAHAIRSAAEVKNNPADLINVALEMLVQESLELPAFSTLDAMAGRIRREVNTAMFERIGAGSAPDRVGLEGLLEVDGPGREEPVQPAQAAAGRASWSGFASRSRICDGSTRSATRRRGWRGSRSRRSPTSLVKPRPLTPG